MTALVPAFAGQGAKASEYEHLVAKHAAAHGVPEALVRRVIHIETKGNPALVSKGNYGLMQIRLETARAMGYRGDGAGLLDADTNMTYAVRYLAGAYRAARGNPEQAIRNYQRGYYESAKAQGFSPYAVASVPQQAAAPDPAMVQADVRRQAIEQQRVAAEQQRQAALQTRIEQQKAAEGAYRAASGRAAELGSKSASRPSRRASRSARRWRRRGSSGRRPPSSSGSRNAKPCFSSRSTASKPKSSSATSASKRRNSRRSSARRTGSSERPSRNRSGQRRWLQRLPSQPAPARRAAAAPSYAWYNPMRYFKHPSHKRIRYRQDPR